MAPVEDAKKERKEALAAYDRAYDEMKALLETQTDEATAKAGLEDFKEKYEGLAEKHDAYAAIAKADTIRGEGDFMQIPSRRMGETKAKTGKLLESLASKAEEERRKSEVSQKTEESKLQIQFQIDSDLKESLKAKAGLDMEYDVFEDLCNELKDMHVETVPAMAIQAELDRLQAEKERLRSVLVSAVSLDPEGKKLDHAAMRQTFKTKVLDRWSSQFKATQVYLKSRWPTEASATPVSSTPVSSTGTRRPSSDIKRETIQLPKFSGKEPEAFTNYPVWSVNWEKLIKAYPVETLAILLLDHVDKAVKDRIVGIEHDYAASMKKLKDYYGNKFKVVECCIADIAKCRPIKNDQDFRGLVQFSQSLETNYKRLQGVEAANELSNTVHTNALINRLPSQIRDRYMSHFMAQDALTRSDPLPVLMSWIEKEREKWEYQEITSSHGVRGATAMFAYQGQGEEGEGFRGECFSCGKSGHMRRDCKKEGGKDGKKLSGNPRHKKSWCAFHTEPPVNHYSNSCSQLRKLDLAERTAKLTANKDCPICLGDHAKEDCRSKRVCGGEKQKQGCGKNHPGHELLCSEAKIKAFAVFNVKVEDSLHWGLASIQELDEETETVESQSFLVRPNEHNLQAFVTILTIMQVSGPKPREIVSVFWDPGATDNFVRLAYAIKAGFEILRTVQMSVTTLGGENYLRDTDVYKCKFRDKEGKLFEFEAFALESLTGPVGQLIMPKLRKLFPRVSQSELYDLQRKQGEVDYLIGLEKPSWHPDKEVRATGDGDLWIFRSAFGSCLGGSHAEVWESTRRSRSLFVVNKTFFASSKVESALAPPPALVQTSSCVQAFMSKTTPLSSEMFFRLESLGAQIDIRCEGCKCGKCPVPGSRFSFHEQQQLDIIRGKLRYDESNKVWITELPWIKPRSLLPYNYFAAKKSLESTERTLRKRDKIQSALEEGQPPSLNVYGSQVHDMVARKAARKLSPEEMANWKGVAHYIPHLVVENPGSRTTPVRLVFDASRPQGPSKICLNDCLAKGPENYLNNLCGVIIAFSVKKEAAKGDITKFYNAVQLVEEDVQCQRFLWRDGEDKEPDVYAVQVNNIGIKPSGTIAACMLEETCAKYKDKYPEAVKDLLEISYVDDLGAGADSSEELHKKTEQMDLILGSGNMKCKKWVFSHEPGNPIEMGGGMEDAEMDEFVEKVLGMVWVPLYDYFKYVPRINFGPKRGKVRLLKDYTKEEFAKNPPEVLTRRNVLSQTNTFFAPTGNLTPVLLTAKVLLRKSWGSEYVKFDWDEPLPPDLYKEWIDFFLLLFDVGDLIFPRSLTPEGEVIGDPMLVICSDGALISFGACCYVRWKLADGGYWCRLIVAKGKIAPKFRATIPRMELSGAVLQVRLEKFVKESTRLKFSKVWHFLDSSTVLGYLHKNNGCFLPYEGVRVAEIQSCSNYNEEGILQDWAWIPGGHENPADLTTKAVTPKEIGPDSMWQKGPAFLYDDESKWPIKRSFSKEPLEGELKVHWVQINPSIFDERMDVSLARCSKLDKLIGTTARAIKLVKARDCEGKVIRVLSKPAKANHVKFMELAKAYPTAEERKEAMDYCIRRSQDIIREELEKSVVPVGVKGQSKVKVQGNFKNLAPKLDSKGIWRVGTRMSAHVPFTGDGQPPILLPNKHPFVELLMRNVHESSGHGGADATTVAFRQRGFWTPQGGKLAKRHKNACVECRKEDAKCLEQPLGPIPSERLIQPTAWGHVELDLFGPYKCRGETNPRSNIKIWGMVLEDKNSGAVHVDVVVGYSTNAVLAALRRFGALRGWPAVVSSDPGSQLESAQGKLTEWWTMLKDPLTEFAGKNKFRWDISPANSPWRQGRVERRIARIKRLLRLAVGNARVTTSELQTIFFEAASITSERPLSATGPKADGSYTVLTPNTLLLGRSSTSLPDDTALCEELNYKERYHVVHAITTAFWQLWAVQCGPKLVYSKKWHDRSTRQLKVGDVVMVADKNLLKAKYKLAQVTAVDTSSDGLVRSARLEYRGLGSKKKRGKITEITRSVQRLALVLSVEEQEGTVYVQEEETGFNIVRE